MSKHTPGSWVWSNEASDSFGHTLNVRRKLTERYPGERIASVVSNNQADACLIAAAPELLEAAKPALDWLRTLLHAGETHKQAILARPVGYELVRLLDAIKAAEGED